MADSPNYNFVPGTLNPTPFKSKHKTYTTSMIIDDALSTHNKIISNNIAPDLYEGATVFTAIIVGVDYSDNEESALYQKLQSVLGPLGIMEASTTVYYCMIPELHGHLVNPLTIDPGEDPYYEDSISHQFPEFHIAAGSDVEQAQCVPGSLVTVEFSDGARQSGEIVRVVKPNDDPNPPRSLSSAMALYNNQTSPSDSNTSTNTSSAATGEAEKIPCTGPSVTINSGVKLVTAAANFIKLVGPWLPNGTRITSGARSSDKQASIIKYYGEKKLQVDPSTVTTREQVEALRKRLTAKPTPGMFIARVKYDPLAPNTSYSGHSGGLALDFAGAALGTLEKHLREAEQYMPSVTITNLLVESSNGCVHVEFPATTTYNADELFTNWQTYTGCFEDPTIFPIVTTTAANYELGPPPDEIDMLAESITEESIDQTSSDYGYPPTSPA